MIPNPLNFALDAGAWIICFLWSWVSMIFLFLTGLGWAVPVRPTCTLIMFLCRIGGTLTLPLTRNVPGPPPHPISDMQQLCPKAWHFYSLVIICEWFLMFWKWSFKYWSRQCVYCLLMISLSPLSPTGKCRTLIEMAVLAQPSFPWRCILSNRAWGECPSHFSSHSSCKVCMHKWWTHSCP